MSDNFRDEMTARMNYLERRVEDKTFELWDYYAAAALSGIVQSSPDFSVEMATESAGWYADAMLRERAKRMESE